VELGGNIVTFLNELLGRRTRIREPRVELERKYFS
jgi:hypothetical protein